MNAAAMLWTIAALGQVQADVAADPDSAVKIQSLWDFVAKGGSMMIPIGLCSLVALSVIVERLISLRRRKVIPADFLPDLTDLLDGDQVDTSKAIKHCEENASPLANICVAGIKRLGQPVEAIEKYSQEAGEREVWHLRKHLRVLSVIASISPLLGLLGTIFGMIIAFQTVATSGEALGKAELLAKGIYQAMITTAAGLIVAIPTLIAYHGFSAKIDRLGMEMDSLTIAFIEEFAAPRQTDQPGIQPALPVTDNERPAEAMDKEKAAPVMAS